MAINSITIWHVPLATLQTGPNQRIATGVDTTSLVLAISTTDGLVGWGEVCPLPGQSDFIIDELAPAVAEMSDTLMGTVPEGPEAMMAQLDAAVPGHLAAKSAIDMALWDMAGKLAGMPVHAMMGGKRATGLPICQDIGPMATDEVVEAAKLSMSGGVRTFRVALGHDKEWRRDVDRLIALRETVGPRANIVGEWGGRGDRVSALRTARETAGMDLILEQPCADLDACQAVRLASGQVLKLDESIHSPADLIAAHARGCVDAVTLKPSRFGGITKARKMRDLCVMLGLPMSIEEECGSDVAMSAMLQLATTTPPELLLFTQDLAGQLTPRLDRYGPSRRSGMIAAPAEAGLGVEPDLDTMGAPLAVLE